MIALQASSSGLGSALVTTVLLALFAGIAGVVGTATVRRLSNPVGKYRLLYVLVLFPITLGAYGYATLAGFGPTVAAWFALESGPVAEALGNFTEFLAAGLVWLTAYAPTVLGVREARGIDLPMSDALRTMARYVVGVSAILAVVLTPVTGSSVTSPPALVAAVVLIAAGLLYGSPWLLPIVRTVTEPSEAVRERIADLSERAGLDVRDVRILDGDAETAASSVRGPPGRRRLFLTGSFTDRFDDGVAAALLAVEAARLDRNLAEIRIGTVAVAGGGGVAAVAGAGPRWPILGVTAVATVAGLALSRRVIRAADDAAAARVGAEALVTALERYAAVHATEPTRRRIPNPVSPSVALGDRIDRLRERPADGDDRSS